MTGYPPVVLIHGAWHGAWLWENWAPLLQARGCEVHVPDLSHVGTGLADRVDRVHRLIEQLPARPVLIGHSVGGLIVQHLLARWRVPGAVLLSSVPPRYPVSVLARTVIRHPFRVLRDAVTGEVRRVVGSRAGVRRALFTAATAEYVVATCHARLTGEPVALFREMLVHRAPSPLAGTPTLVVAAASDRYLGPAMQRKLAYRLNGQFLQIPACGHDIPLDSPWRATADTVARWITRGRRRSELRAIGSEPGETPTPSERHSR